MSAGLPPGYTPPSAGPAPTPWVIYAFRLYCALIILIGLVVGFVWFTVSQRSGSFSTRSEFIASMSASAFLGIMLMLAITLHSIGLACPRRPWMHVFGFVLSGLAVMSSCTPVGIVLLIFWARADTSAWFKDNS